LLELIDRLPARGRLEEWWNAPIARLSAHGLPSSALPVFAAWLARRARRPVLALVPDPEGSFQEAGAWFREDVRTVVFPAVETLPFARFGRSSLVTSSSPCESSTSKDRARSAASRRPGFCRRPS